MAKRVGGSRRKTRYAYRKPIRERGKISLTRYLQSFATGDRVKLSVEPAVQKGAHFPRFEGRVGTISGKQGAAYNVTIRDGGKEKILIVRPIHLRRI